MSLTLKIGSLVIRTLAKPIANTIKRNAREHERFRKICVNFAQFLHRTDMRMRLGLLTDPAVIERQVQRELERAEAKKRAAQAPTVLTEAEMKAAEEAAAKEKEEIAEKAKSAHKHARIRPLSESKAIDTGANFISEFFMFMVAAGVIGFESWRSKRKETSRREDVADKIDALEQKVSRLEAELLAANKGQVDVDKFEAKSSRPKEENDKPSSVTPSNEEHVENSTKQR